MFSSWILLHRYFLIIVTELLYWRKNLCGCFHFLWPLLLFANYEKVCTTNACSLSIFIPFQLQSWIILRVWTKFLVRNFYTKRVIMEIAMMKIFNNCMAGRLINRYFQLNKNSSLYQQCFIYSTTAW